MYVNLSLPTSYLLIASYNCGLVSWSIKWMDEKLFLIWKGKWRRNRIILRYHLLYLLCRILVLKMAHSKGKLR